MLTTLLSSNPNANYSTYIAVNLPSSNPNANYGTYIANPNHHFTKNES